MLNLPARFATRSGRVRSRFTAAGDAARDRKCWSEAADHYRSHLLLAPGDGAIWVQLGHMLKEQGRFADSLEAYRRAAALITDNHDVLLHLGHSYLASGNMAEGIKHLRDSVAAGGSLAMQDLARLGVTASDVRSPPKNAERNAILNAITRNCNGLRAVDCSSIKLLPNGDLQTLSSDPWIVFEWAKGAKPSTALATLTVEARPRNADMRLLSQLYADMGDGFSERLSTRFFLPSGRTEVILVEPDRIDRLRWDPDQAENILYPPRLVVRPQPDFDALKAEVRENSPADADLDTLIAMLDDVQSGERARQAKPRPLAPVIALDFELARSIEFSHDYDYWLLRNQAPTPEDYQIMKKMESDFAIRPRFSFVMPTYNTPLDLLKECMDSLLAQTYENFEICVADDNSPNRAVVDLLEDYAQRDVRVKVAKRTANGHISAASNSALALASGDFVVLVDHDDLIPDFTLFVVAHYINRHPKADILYSDEDKITETGQRLQPYFKSGFNKFLIYGHNMVSHLGVYRRSLIEKVGGFRLGLEGSQDYDLLLRCYEQSSEENIVHIPHILYHWRIIPGSTAMAADQKSYAVLAAQQAINGHFERTGMPLRSCDGFAPGCTGVRPSTTSTTPVSIIIPTRNGLDLLKACIDSILERPCDHAEIIVVDNGSDESDSLLYLETLERKGIARVLREPGEFNFSRINNVAASVAGGDILCFLNNDTEIVSGDWLNRARVFLSMPDIGIVGARLLYPDATLQHFGIALGMGDHKVAGTPHLGMDANLPGYFGKARLLQEVSAVTAACMFIRRADFAAIGGFNEDLRVAYNDVDLCLKVRDRGLRILADPDITLIHKESRTRGSDKLGARADRLAQEARWMRDRWATQLDSDPYVSPNIDLGRVDFAYAAKPRRGWPWDSVRASS